MRRLIVLFITILLIGCGSKSKDGIDIVSSADAATGSFVSGINTTIRTIEDLDGVALVLCADNETVLGGGTRCSGEVGDGSSGVVFSSFPVGNSWLGACFPISWEQPDIPVQVYAICATAIMGDALINSVAINAPDNSDKIEAEEQKLLQMIKDHRNNLQ